MLPKPEKTRKGSASSHQLDLVETISTEDKLNKKRRFLYIALSATIGLSFLFWTYHTVSNLVKSSHRLLPRIVIPTLKTNPGSSGTNLNKTIDDQITQIVDLDTGRWNIYLYILPDGLNYFNWSKNSTKLSEQEINTTIEKIKNLKVNKDSSIKSSLPQGLDVREILSKDSSHSRIQALVTIPERQIFFDIGVEGGDLKKSDALISQLVTTLYWTIVQSLPPSN